MSDFTEDALVKQPDIALFAELGRQALNACQQALGLHRISEADASA